MSFFPSIEEPAGQYLPQGGARSFLKDDQDKTSLDASPWAAPRSPGLADYSQFTLSHASKAHADLSTSFSDAQYSTQYLSPVSPGQASFGAIHSPQIDSDTYDPMASWNSFAMPSPTPEYDLIGQNPYPQESAGYGSLYVRPIQVEGGSHLDQSGFQGTEDSINFVKQEPDAFGSELAYDGRFSRMHSSGHVADARDPIMVAHPNATASYLPADMDIDRGVSALTPPEEDDHHHNAPPPPRHNGRSRKRPQSGTKDAHKSAYKRAKARAAAGPPRGVACKTCDESFRDNGHLQDHLQQAHARPLVCVFGYAGCTATFGSKNEWKRHVVSQHIILNYWLCTDADCVRANPRTGGTVFNRKDLYTQHVRRMHVPEAFREALGRKEHQPEWDRVLRRMQDGAERRRCELPGYMECPAPGCGLEFRGASAWDDRMEHVAKHLDGARPGEPSVVFGGDADRTLTEWARSPEVNIVRCLGGDRWELVVPLKTTAKEVGSTRKLGGPVRLGYADEDADGELE